MPAMAPRGSQQAAGRGGCGSRWAAGLLPVWQLHRLFPAGVSQRVQTCPAEDASSPSADLSLAPAVDTESAFCTIGGTWRFPLVYVL